MTEPQKAHDLLGGAYPRTWAAFIGQDQAKAQLRTAARSARQRKVPMAHCLLKSGTPGIGKTSLALLASAEMRSAAQVVSGKIGMHDARLAFSYMKDGDVLIIDEAHQMVEGGKAKAEWLLHYLQDGVLMTPMGAEVQPKVTIIACTTDAGRLPETLLSRFRVTPDLIPYTEAEAAKIALGMAKRILGTENLPTPCAANCRQIARAASHNPRMMAAILEAVRDIALVNRGENHVGSKYDLSKALQWLGLTEDGLTSTARRYMLVLLTDFGSRPAGMAAMQDRLQEPGGLGYTERLLMDKGFLAKSAAGRVLTAEGIRRTKALAA